MGGLLCPRKAYSTQLTPESVPKCQFMRCSAPNHRAPGNILTRDQRQSMLTHEGANVLIWSQRTRAETADAVTIPERCRESAESAEEKIPTDDEETNANASPGMTTLLDNMRADQNLALSSEGWTEANQIPIQQAIICLLDATTGPSPEGMSMQVTSTMRGVCQRIYTWHRKRGSDERTERNKTSLFQLDV